ncbi:MAG: FecR domain-containing protein [Pirellulales bacterium]|nr:FecR domain-containing protein [Pirellulales bacterium]
MNDLNSEPSENRLDKLAENLFDAHLSESEQAELLTCLNGDPAECDRFVERVMLHAILRRELGSYRPPTLIESLFEVSGEAAPPPPDPKPSFWAGTPGWSIGAMLGTATTTFLALLVFAGIWWSKPPRSSAPQPSAEVAQYAGAAAPQAPAPFPMISSLQVKSGTSTLSLDKIGTVVLEGEADFSLIGPMKARLTRGSIKMRVTQMSGRGFEIETPYGTVRDLGTEFGLNVSRSGQTGLVVFDGSVDLRLDKPDRTAKISPAERLEIGDGVTFDKRGRMDRIMSIVTGTVATFQPGSEPQSKGAHPVILNVSDNLRASDTKKYYEIVPRGLKEDALAYVDRRGHEWNGWTKSGMPSYLRGADYVKTFMVDKQHDNMEIQVTLGCPAKLYVFYDRRLPPPDWLRKDFRHTRDVIGMDIGPFPKSNPKDIRLARGKGPGKNVDDLFIVWERIVSEPGAVKLGPNQSVTDVSSMYGIAAKALEANSSAAIK